MPVEFVADLHIHTCLSPCAELSMTPKGIVEKAASLGINIIAVCDHNSAENGEVTKDLAKKKGINVIAGMEISSSEEVHVLGFSKTQKAFLRCRQLFMRNFRQEKMTGINSGCRLLLMKTMRSWGLIKASDRRYKPLSK